MIELPKELQKTELNFILLGKQQKNPIEKWQENNYCYTDKRFKEHLAADWNYGVICGNGLIVIDADTPELNELVQKHLDTTFTVRTGKGIHYYYICVGFERKRVLQKNGKHLGEVQSTGTYVVGANSIHPSGAVYSVVNDHPITFISKTRLDNLFSEFYSGTKVSGEVIKVGAPTGLRNESMFKLACSFREKSLTQEETYSALVGLNEKNNPPLPPSELRTIVDSAYSYKKNSFVEQSPEFNQVYGIEKEVYTLIAEKKRFKATELIASTFEETNHIYTTRDDVSSECWIYKDGIFVPQGRTYIKEFCRMVLGRLYSSNLCNAVMDKIEVDTYIDQELFFKEEPPYLIPVNNGIIDIRTRELIQFSPEFKFFSKVPIDYIPGKDCPMIKNFFQDLFWHTDEVIVIQEIFGFLLYREYFLEKAFMYLGSGRNGKGKTLDLMKRFLGVENCSEISLESMEKDQFAVGELFKKHANLCGDLSKTALTHTGEFKKLTGRDLLSAPRKFKTRVNFVNHAKMIFSCNELPITYDITEAFFNRWAIIDFPFTFLPEPEFREVSPQALKTYKLRDSNIIDRITTVDEMQGLLNWALDGLERLLKNRAFSFSPSTQQVKEKWLRKSDSCMAFCMDNIVMSVEGKITKQEFRGLYSQYCKQYNLTISSDKTINYVLSRNFGAMDDRRVDSDGIQKLFWIGIAFKSQIEKQNDLDKQKKLKESLSIQTEFIE